MLYTREKPIDKFYLLTPFPNNSEADTYFGDWKFRQQLLNTADKAGGTKRENGTRLYKLAEFMLIGEAITLVMRTNVKRQ